MSYRLWLNPERTVFVRQWEGGTVEVATREHPSGIWGAPQILTEEQPEQASADERSGEASSPLKGKGS